MFEPTLEFVGLALQTGAADPSGSGGVYVPWWVVGAVGVGFTSLGGFVYTLWKASEERDRRTAEALEQAQQRLYEVLLEKSGRKEAG